MKIIFSIIGLIIGAIIDGDEGAAFGFFIGILAGSLINQNRRLRELEQKLREFRETTSPADAPVKQTTETPPTPEPKPEPVVQQKAVTEDEDEVEDVTLIPLEPSFEIAGEEPRTAEQAWQESSEVEPDTLKPTPEMVKAAKAEPSWEGEDPVSGFIKKFFTTGNVVVKVGVILLFIGVSFLLKLAVEHQMFPIEFRFASVAAGAIAMLIFGWRLRHEKQKYALVLQGGAVGILYITVFSAAKLYTIVPLGFAFSLMLAIVVFSSILAIIQDSRSLAVFAVVGGFLAPILTSSNTGSHIALFSYYGLLNLGILFIAWHKSWRILNWLGFVFTFVIASIWGIHNYDPEKFSTTEPFLILFFIYYVAIAILFAHRQPPKLKGLVDGSLVFGTPLVGFTLQGALVKNFEYGLTWSAVALSAVYIILARFFWKKNLEGMRNLCESFLSIGVIFASLAIPFALEGRWTAAAWALEGAGIAWMGIRQRRVLPRAFGLFLQFAASVAFLLDFKHPHPDYPILNAGYVGSVMISISALFLGLQYYRHKDKVLYAARDMQVVLLAWGLIWWFAAGLIEIDHHVLQPYEFNISLLFIALSFWLMFILARALRWSTAEKAPVLLLPIIYVFAIFRYFDQSYLNPFLNYGYLGWIAAFAVQYGLLYRAETSWKRGLLEYWHVLTMWVYVFMATWIIANAISMFVSGMARWGELFWGIIPMIGLYKLIFFRNWSTWPLKQYREQYLTTGLFPIAIYLLVWVIVRCHEIGDPAPLPYIPILNPQDIAQLFAMLGVFTWVLYMKRGAIPNKCKFTAQQLFMMIAVTMFIWINSVVAHGVHFYAGITYEFDNMFRSEIFQTSISIVWTLTAFLLMGIATQHQYRKPWFVGAALLGAVVLKLFLVDLDDSGTVARIISFISVGILMLVIGYFAPIPPKAAEIKTQN